MFVKRLSVFSVMALAAVSLQAAAVDKDPVFALPKMRTAPVVDGVIGEDEWKDAAETQLFVSIDSETAFPGDASVWIGRDGEKLYAAARMIVSPHGLCWGAKPPARGGAVSQEVAFGGDGFEFDFISDKSAKKETVYHMILSAAGCYYSSGVENGLPVAWDPGAFEAKSTVKDGYWNFEFAVPIAALRYRADEAATHAFRFARNWKYLGLQGAFGIQSTLTPHDNCFGQASGACLTPFDDAAPVVQLKTLGMKGHGGDGTAEVYPIKLRVANPTDKAMDLKVRILGKPVNSQPILVDLPVTLKPGEEKVFDEKGPVLSDEEVNLEIRVTSADGQKVYHARTIRFAPNFPAIPWLKHSAKGAGVDFKMAYYPSDNKVRLRADLAADKKHGPNASVRYTLLDAADRTLWSVGTQADAKGVADGIFDIPDLAAATRATGTADYRLVMNAAGVSNGIKTNAFVRHVFDWEGNKLGLSAAVVRPFEPMTVTRANGRFDGARTVKTVLREHTLGEYELMSRVVAAGKDVLARPMRLIGEFKGHATDAWDYDGCQDWTLTLDAGQTIDSLKLEISIRAERAPLMHACPDSLRITYAGKVPEGKGRVWQSGQVPHVSIIGDYLPYIWIGGTLRGISVFGENDRGWEVAEGVPHQEIVREADGTVTLVLNLIAKPVTLEKPRTIHLGFQVTPVKPMLANWRQKPFGELYGSGYYWGVGPADADVIAYDGTTRFWDELSKARDTGKVDQKFLDEVLATYPYPKKDRQFHYNRMLRHHRAGMDMAVRAGRKTPTCWYTNARGVDFTTKQGDTYCDEWDRQQWMSRPFGEMAKRDYDLDPCASFRDYAAWWYRKMLLSGACDFLYWDDIFLQSNFNLVGTEAYRLPEGDIQPATGVWNMRALVRRCAVLQAELGLDDTGNWIHMTSTAIAPISAFAGVHYDWEDGAGVNDFQDRYGMDYILACSIGRQMGCRVKMMGYFGKTTPEESKRLHRCALGVMLAHEFDWGRVEAWRKMDERLRAWGYRSADVAVWNYWDEDVPLPAKIEGGRAATLVMAKGKSKSKVEVEGEAEGKALVIVSDFAEGGAYAVKPDAATLGLPAGYRAYDFETGAELPLKDGAAQVALKKHDFAIIEFVAQGTPTGGLTPVNQTVEQAMDASWKRVMTALWDPETGCIYDYISSNRFGEVSYKACLPTPEEMALQFPNPNGWRMGLEDCDLKGGPMLVAAIRRLEAHGGKDDEARATIEKVYKGLRNCATVSGIPGFVARGVSPLDGKSFYINSSRDQYTLFIYSMWRYYRSGYADAARKAEIRQMLVDIAKMLNRIMTDPAAKMTLPRADGKPGDVGYMWVKDPHRIVRVPEDDKFVYFDDLMNAHEAFRLSMFYAAAWDVSGDDEWRTEQLKYMDDAFFMTGPDFVPYGFDIPSFALYQAQVSHRLLWEVEPDATVKAKLEDVMRRFAKMADRTFDTVEKKLSEITDAEMYGAVGDWRERKFIYRSGRNGGNPPGELISGLPYMIPATPDYWKPQCIPELLGLSLLSRLMVPGESALPESEIARFRRIAASADWSRHGMSSMSQMLLAYWALEVTRGERPRIETPWKGKAIFLFAPKPANVGRFCDFVRNRLAKGGFTHLFLRMNYYYQFKSHPECAAKDALSEADVKAIVKACRESGIMLVPKANLFGHQGERKGVVKDGLLSAHPDMDESRGFDKIRQDYYRCICPRHPDSVRIVLDLADELAKVFESDAIHVGCDEVLEIGRCARCRDTSVADLFADWVNGLNRGLKARGVKTVYIWGDRLLDSKTTYNGVFDCSDSGTAAALAKLDRDIVICDWHYSNRTKPYPSVGIFEKAGFKTWIVTWCNTDAAASFVRSALAQDHGGVQGVMLSVWDSFESYADALEGRLDIPREQDPDRSKDYLANLCAQVYRAFTLPVKCDARSVPMGCDPSVKDAAYWAKWNKAELDRIDAAIAANRTAEGTFEVAGLPPETDVSVQQVSHPFAEDFEDLIAHARATFGEDPIVAHNAFRAWFAMPEPKPLAPAAKKGDRTGSYWALRQLVTRDFRTGLDPVKSGKDGKLTFKGYRGRYELEWNNTDGKTEKKTVVLCDRHATVEL